MRVLDWRNVRVARADSDLTGDEVRTDAEPLTEPVANSFDALQARLDAMRNEMALGDDRPAADARATHAGARSGRGTPSGAAVDVVREALSSGTRRGPAWDLILLGVAWSGLAALVVLALQAA